MATCEYCRQETPHAWTCDRQHLHQRGRAFPLGRWWREDHDGPAGRSGRCPGCGVYQGGFHHPGCPVAACPSCLLTLATCGCHFDERPASPTVRPAA